MPNISAKHTEFIRLVASGVPKNKAYTLTSPNKNLTKATARVEGSNLAKQYALEIQQAKENDVALVAAAHNSNVSQKALHEVLEFSKVDAQLCKVIMGEEFEVKRMNSQGQVLTAKITPECSDILKAIQIYNNRFGLNAPTKIAATDAKGNDAPPMIVLNQFMGAAIEIKESE